MKKLDRLSGIFWFILSAAVCVHSYQLGVGKFHDPGPGFLFFCSGLALGILSLIILFPAMKRHNDALKEDGTNILENVKWVKILSILAALVFYGLILEQLGFLISTGFFIAFLLGSIEKKKWYIIVFVSVVTSVLSYALFELWLESRLPKGIFGI